MYTRAVADIPAYHHDDFSWDHAWCPGCGMAFKHRNGKLVRHTRGGSKCPGTGKRALNITSADAVVLVAGLEAEIQKFLALGTLWGDCMANNLRMYVESIHYWAGRFSKKS